MRREAALRAPFLWLWAVLLTALTGFLGAAPLKVLRSHAGRAPFWLFASGMVALLTGLGFGFLAAVFGIVALTVGLYAEFEDHKFNINTAAGLSVFAVSFLIFSAYYVWAIAQGKGWWAKTLEYVTNFLTNAQKLGLPLLDVKLAEALAQQIPSAVISIVAIVIMVALTLERAASRWVGITIRRRERLTDFSAPEVLIWPFIASLLGAFGQFHMKAIEVVSLNVLNVCATIYFFQGLAVLGKYFEVFRIGTFWRVVWTVILTLQLPMILGVTGVADYWMNFRKTFTRRAAGMKKERVEE